VGREGGFGRSFPYIIFVYADMIIPCPYYLSDSNNALPGAILLDTIEMFKPNGIYRVTFPTFCLQSYYGDHQKHQFKVWKMRKRAAPSSTDSEWLPHSCCIPTIFAWFEYAIKYAMRGVLYTGSCRFTFLKDTTVLLTVLYSKR